MTPRQCGSVAGVRGLRLALQRRLASIRILLMCLLAMGTASCAKHRIPVLPLTFNPSMTSLPDPMEPPHIAANPPDAVPFALIVPAARPPRPVIRANGAPATAAVEPVSPKPAPPRISMRLSPAEESDYRQRTNASISIAEKNLQSISSSTLSVAQQDLVEKIRGFLSQSREAIRSGDWLRAHNLAQKAQVLSEELVNLK